MATTPGAAIAAGCDRPLRADARRNRERVLKAARAVFAEYGREAQMDDVARRAKVGVGTLYRHFPTKDALIEALAMDRFVQLAELAHDALAEDDPWEALAGFMHRAARLQIEDRALSQILLEQPKAINDAGCERGGLGGAVERLVERAQAAGVLRPDVVAWDVASIVCALRGDTWQRHLAIALDGLRAGAAATTLPGD